MKKKTIIIKFCDLCDKPIDQSIKECCECPYHADGTILFFFEENV